MISREELVKKQLYKWPECVAALDSVQINYDKVLVISEHADLPLLVMRDGNGLWWTTRKWVARGCHAMFMTDFEPTRNR